MNTNKTKRLFLFAGYDSSGTVDASLVHYVRALSAVGDVVLVMDSNADDTQLDKVAPYTLYRAARRHGEYDFGSYKRAWQWARDNLNPGEYEFVYMVNDSVYGPLYDLVPYLTRMESENWDAFGLVKNPHKTAPHIQSWFIGMRANVFMSDWFNEFLTSVTQLPDKGSITVLYEHGFTRRLIERGIAWGALYSAPGRSIYNNIWKYFRRGMPFIKKNAFVRHGGAFGFHVWRVMRRIDAGTRDAILENARRVYGNKTVDHNITCNPICAIWRNIKHGIGKLTHGEI